MNSGLRLLLFISFSFAVCVYADSFDEQPTLKTLRKARNTYIVAGVGTGYGQYLDFATSPLTYSGLTFNTGLGILKQSSIKESAFRVQYVRGQFKNKAQDGRQASDFSSLSFQHSVLNKLEKYSNHKTRFLLGGMIDATGTYRVNNSLMNAAYGFEVFSTVFVSGKVRRNFERKETVSGKFLGLIKYKKKLRLRTLSYQLNLPLMNSVFRNDYGYLSEGIYQMNPVFENYSFKVFNGFRINTRLDYEWHLKNNNRIGISYIWDAYKTGGHFEYYQIAQHLLQFSLIFNLK
jgi:hypothetical protein